MKKLCELEWFSELYRKIYKIASIENPLPDPCEIVVLGHGESLESAPEAKLYWFRDKVPSPESFAYDLLFSERNKAVSVLAMMFSRQLAKLAVLLAKRDIVPRINIARLFSDITEDDLLNALSKVYRKRFRKLDDYLKFAKLSPMYLETSGFKPSDIPRLIIAFAIANLIDGAEHNKKKLEAALELLRVIEEKQNPSPKTETEQPRENQQKNLFKRLFRFRS